MVDSGLRKLDAAVPVLRKLDYVLADTLDDADQAFDDELIEGVVGRIAMAVIYGDSNSGKPLPELPAQRGGRHRSAKADGT